ncbi:MAG: hypothetical protein AAFU79_07920 [Myxococcota bacterium]
MTCHLVDTPEDLTEGPSPEGVDDVISAAKEHLKREIATAQRLAQGAADDGKRSS